MPSGDCWIIRKVATPSDAVRLQFNNAETYELTDSYYYNNALTNETSNHS